MEEISDYHILEDYRIKLGDISDMWMNSMFYGEASSPQSLNIKMDTGYIYMINFATKEECVKCFKEICYARDKYSKNK